MTAGFLKAFFSKGSSSEMKYLPILSIVCYVLLNWHSRKMFVLPTLSLSLSHHSHFVRKLCPTTEVICPVGGKKPEKNTET